MLFTQFLNATTSSKDVYISNCVYTFLCPEPLMQDGWTPLMMASYWGKGECVKVLLDRGAHANLQNNVSEV